MENPETATVTVVYHHAGFIAGCKKCGQVLNRGTFTIGVEIGNHKYFVGCNPPITHCDEEKMVPILFSDETSAEQAKRETIDTLKKDGNTNNLQLLEMAVFTSKTVH